MLNPAAAQDARCGDSVTVSRGDTLSKIARRCGTSVEAMLGSNPHIRNPNIVPLGAALNVPGREKTADQEEPVRADGAIEVSIVETETGNRVLITASGLPPRTRVWIKSGRSQSADQHLVLRGARTDGEGRLRARLRSPQWSGTKSVRYSIAVPQTGATLVSTPLKRPSARAAGKTR
ncbi:LysM peptidoglycan-binding domain-containing protein [Microvirga roseola]|uniref:LysM peptidoglycan-binding domain-containing protein n=1 Tax=Microvirga roseola TaxID=2883126 RepID=UPI001E2E28E3|nr:LysM peptidoglycan-binding domain-containing protein [Microvirga roseola]